MWANTAVVVVVHSYYATSHRRQADEGSRTATTPPAWAHLHRSEMLRSWPQLLAFSASSRWATSTTYRNLHTGELTSERRCDVYVRCRWLISPGVWLCTASTGTKHMPGTRAKLQGTYRRTSDSWRQPSSCRLRSGASGGSWMTTLRTPQHPLARSTSSTDCRKAGGVHW